MRGFDHVVLPVADLTVARARYEALGFTVAPDGIHPFGTANCGVFLRDGGFLEPLALVDGDLRDRTVAEGANDAFVRGHRDYCDAVSPEGFSHLVLRSQDAATDRTRFAELDILAGRTQFGRIAGNGHGDSQDVAFDLTFAADAASPNSGYFTCQSLLPTRMDFAPLTTHANGVTGVTHIFSTAADPHEHLDFVERFVGGTPDGGESYLSVDISPATWLIDRLEGMADILAADITDMPMQSGIMHVGLQFAVGDLGAVSDLLKSNGIHSTRSDGTIIVPPTAGQGYWALFAADGSADTY